MWGGGRPPEWIDSASAAEAWALATVTSRAPWGPKIITDCLGLLHTAEAGATAATRSSKQLARTWATIAGHLDGNISEMVTSKRLRWMPAHQGPGAIGVAVKSDGKPITVLEWRANRLVDAIAKAEASKGVAPQGTVDLLKSAAALVQHSAAQTGAATFAANNHIISVQLESGKVVNKTIRDVQEAPAKKKAQRPCCKEAASEKEPPAESASEWDSDDELQAYGPNTKRSRRAAQKKIRKQSEHDALRRVVVESAASAKPVVRGGRPCDDTASTAVEDLIAAASGSLAAPSLAAKEYNPPQPVRSMWWVFSEPTATDPGGFTATAGADEAPKVDGRVEGCELDGNEAVCKAAEVGTKVQLHEEVTSTAVQETVAAAKGQFWPVVSSSSANYVGAVQFCEAEGPSRSRPVKAGKSCRARVAEEAVQSVLGNKRCRHGSGDEPRRKKLQRMEKALCCRVAHTSIRKEG